MSQLSYQQALDPYHAAFRLLRIAEITSKDTVIPVDSARILDFFLLFPGRAGQFRFKPAHARFRKISRELADLTSYADQPDAANIFTRMGPIQIAAWKTLAEQSILDPEPFEDGLICFSYNDLPNKLSDRIQQRNNEQGQICNIIKTLAEEYETLGKDGIKGRSELLEYRYDPV